MNFGLNFKRNLAVPFLLWVSRCTNMESRTLKWTSETFQTHSKEISQSGRACNGKRAVFQDQKTKQLQQSN